MAGCADDASCADATDSAGQAADEAGGDFGGAMAVAEMLTSSAALAQKNRQATPSGGMLQQPGGSSVTKGEAAGQLPGQIQGQQAATATREAGKFEKSAPRSPELGEEKGALIQKMAVGSNTGAEIAGLKPWSKEWVMEGGLNRHPQQKTLLEADTRGESADATSRLAGLAKLMAAASAQSQGSVQDASLMEGMEEGELAGMMPELEGAEYSAQASGQMAGSSERSPVAGRKKTLSGNDFLSIRQGAATEAGTSQSAASRNLKVIPGGLQAPVMTAPVLGEGRPKDPLQPVQQQGAQANDTLGLIHPEMNAKTGTALNRSALPFAAGPGTLQLNGAVVPGAMQRNRLSSESVLGVSQGIRELKASGGGEMRLKLKPDHLGELHLRVSAGGRAGSEIALQIQASDDRAKKILEESIGSLKDGLAGQSLTLSKVDVQVAPAVSSSSSSNSFQQDGLPNPNLASQQDGSMSGRNSSQGEPRERMDGLRSAQGKSASQAFSGASRASARSASGSGRIDVMA